jgi:hypothetical protein
MKNVLDKYFEFFDRLFGFIYEWTWKAITMFLGMLVLEFYLPGLLEFVAPMASRWFVTLLLISALLTFIQQAVEPVVAGLFLHKNEPEDEEETAPELASIEMQAENAQ